MDGLKDRGVVSASPEEQQSDTVSSASDAAIRLLVRVGHTAGVFGERAGVFVFIPILHIYPSQLPLPL